ncbi:uncharacterized protein HD556DRAFT_511422 [Suillus plorans]|uniref:Uncharacterized protein n=1 Tax=Suillus plorans TaxID=116603 RepID=A0A9P7AQX6_9AGAM|nr:uncharacterized protein HD556DRAFT_511422 [Suillus plorans]KAG1793524.1 hypothetical protein HD556DRAFT_511422 [Suillus plorans]
MFEPASRHLQRLATSTDGEARFLTYTHILTVSCQACCNHCLLPSDQAGPDFPKHWQVTFLSTLSQIPNAHLTLQALFVPLAYSHEVPFSCSSLRLTKGCVLWFRTLRQRLWTQKHNHSTRVWMFWRRMMAPLPSTSRTYPAAISKRRALSGYSRHLRILKYFSLLPGLFRRSNGPWILTFLTYCISCLIFLRVASTFRSASACTMALTHLYYGCVLQEYPGRSNCIVRGRPDHTVFDDILMASVRTVNGTVFDTTMNLSRPGCNRYPFHIFWSEACPDTVPKQLSHLLPYHFVTGQVTKGIEDLGITVISKLLLSPISPSNQIVANCTLLACVMVGTQVDKKDIVRIDKRCYRLI